MKTFIPLILCLSLAAFLAVPPGCRALPPSVNRKTDGPALPLWTSRVTKAKGFYLPASVVVTSDMVVMAGAANAMADSMARGLRRSDGKPVWQMAEKQLGHVVLSPLHSAAEVFFVPFPYENRSGAQAVDVHTGQTLWQTNETDSCRTLIGVYGSIAALTDSTGRQLQLVVTRTGQKLDPGQNDHRDLIATEILAQGKTWFAVTILERPCILELDKATLTPIPSQQIVPAWGNPEMRPGSAEVIGAIFDVNVKPIQEQTDQKQTDQKRNEDFIVRVDEDNGMAGHSLLPKFLLCLGRHGERRWQFPAFPSPSDKPDWSDRIASAWIIPSAGIVMAQNREQALFGVRLSDGKLLWKRDGRGLFQQHSGYGFAQSVAVYKQGVLVLSMPDVQWKREANRNKAPVSVRRRLDYMEARTGKAHFVADLTLGTTQGEFISTDLSMEGDNLFVATSNGICVYSLRALLPQVAVTTPARKQQTARLPAYAFMPLASLPSRPNCRMQGSQALAVNNRGQIVGQSWEHPVMWQNGSLQELPLLPGDNVGAAYAINNQGDILVHSEKRGGVHEAPITRDFLLRQGKIVQFATENPKIVTLLAGLNDAGQIIGQQVLSTDVSSSDPIRRTFAPRGFVWRNGVITWLTANPAASYVLLPLAMNNRGQILGELSASSYASVVGPLLWENGWTRKLDGLTLAGRTLTPTALNDAGLIVGAVGGTVQNTEDSAVAYNEPGVWHAGKQITLMTPEGADWFTANALNQQGQVVGSSREGAFTWQAGQMLLLTNILPQDSAWVQPVAKGINDQGQIVGYQIAQSRNASGKSVDDNVRRAFLLTPQIQKF